MSVSEKLRRRAVVAGTAVALAAALTPAVVRAATLVATPRQTPGPFYPRTLPLDRDNDLLRVDGQTAQAAGTPTHIAGRVLTEDGRPVRGAMVELWQCDAKGIYHHPLDRRGPADAGFQGYGSTAVDDEGGYRFRTIRPVAYPGRTPHIHFAVSGRGLARLTTQMYVAGDPANARDGLFNSIADPAQRASVLVALVPAPDLEAGALFGQFDLVLGPGLFTG